MEKYLYLAYSFILEKFKHDLACLNCMYGTGVGAIKESLRWRFRLV